MEENNINENPSGDKQENDSNSENNQTDNTEGPKQGKVKVRSLLSKKEFILVAAVFAAVLALLIYTFFTPNYYSHTAPLRFEISQGMSLRQTIDSLYKYGVIPDKRNMRIAAFIYGADKKIKAGRYKIPNGLSYVSLLELFIKGEREIPQVVTFQEGITISQFAHILKTKVHADSAEVMRLCSDTVFIRSLGLDVPTLEGYLLPDTYYIYDGTPADKVIRRLRQEFAKFFSDSLRTQLKKMKYNLHQVLTVASIVEGESNMVKEFPVIAGVYYNRLESGMKLQADPTVQYAFNSANKWKRLFNKDLLVNSPYNTYVNYGLPPGPINNPGKAAILGALFPQKHNYLYFVADGTGGHKFSATYDEHLKLIAAYRSIITQQLQQSAKN